MQEENKTKQTEPTNSQDVKKTEKTDIVKVDEKSVVKSDKKEITKATNKNLTKKSLYANKKANKRKKSDSRFDKDDGFEQRILDLARVTRVMAGGKRMRFRACVVIGNKKGKIGIGLAKGADVTLAVNKAVAKAKKEIIDVPIVNDTIPHEVYYKLGASRLLFKPASKGRGVIAGGAVRVILELSGIKNISSKILGTNNKVSNARCTIEALRSLKQVEKKKKEVKPEKANNKKDSKKKDNKKKE